MSAPDDCGLLVVSPHPDDAALCLGAALLARRWSRPLVWNIFSRQHFSLLDDDPARARQRILREERAAAQELGVELLFGDFPEAELRGYTRLSRRLRPDRAAPAAEDRPVLERVTGELERLLSRRHPRVVALPLAVGGHVDHLLAREAALSLLAPVPRSGEPEVLLYEDLPYALHEPWRRAPLDQLAGRGLQLREQLLEVTGFLQPKGEVLALYRGQLRRREIRAVIAHGGALAGGEHERTWRLER